MVSLFLLYHFGFSLDSVKANKMNYDMRKASTYITVLPEELPVSVRGILLSCRDLVI